MSALYEPSGGLIIIYVYCKAYFPCILKILLYKDPVCIPSLKLMDIATVLGRCELIFYYVMIFRLTPPLVPILRTAPCSNAWM